MNTSDIFYIITATYRRALLSFLAGLDYILFVACDSLLMIEQDGRSLWMSFGGLESVLRRRTKIACTAAASMGHLDSPTSVRGQNAATLKRNTLRGSRISLPLAADVSSSGGGVSWLTDERRIFPAPPLPDENYMTQ